jgi:hypothetical protein
MKKVGKPTYTPVLPAVAKRMMRTLGTPPAGHSSG